MSHAGELERIDRLLAAFRAAGGATAGAGVLLGPGDDAAILQAAEPLAITTDALVEDVHFRRAWATWEQVGAKALAVNLSDLAAMGARPFGFTCALALPPAFDADALDQLGAGLARHARRWNVILLGGNFSRGREVSVTLTALGTVAPPGLRRDAARPGDAVLLIGEVGVAAAELAAVERGLALPPGRSALLDPEPLVEAGQRVAQVASCAIDVSDGLLHDLGHVAAASGVRVEIDFAAIPRSARFRALAGEATPETRARHLLAGGEDYALAVVCPAGPARALAQEVSAVTIGRVLPGAGVAVLGAPGGVGFDGHDHFRTE